MVPPTAMEEDDATTNSTDPNLSNNPLPPTLRENDHFLLHFADNRQIFAQAVKSKSQKKGNAPACKINKRTYATNNLIGLRYGTVLEVGRDGLVPLEEGEDLLPDEEGVLEVIQGATELKNEVDVDGKKEDTGDVKETTAKNGDKDNINNANNIQPSTINANDNRNLVDDNTSQRLTPTCVQTLLSSAPSGSHVVAALISNSATFHTKTKFSQAKYVKRKQMKHQMRCRIVRITPATLCSAMHLKDPKRVCNLREDTLGQLLSYANISAGSRVLVFDTAVQGIITASCTRRMGGYGSVYSLFSGQQPSYLDWVVNRMNFTIGERQSLKWVSMGEVFGDYDAKAAQTQSMIDSTTGEVIDVEKKERERIEWPAPLQQHTREYLSSEEFKGGKKVEQFLARRSARFTRKLTRYSMLELREMMDRCRDESEILDGSGAKESTRAEAGEATTTETKKGEDDKMDTAEDESTTPTVKDKSSDDIQQCDSLIIATKYDPTATILRLLPYLAPSCPFVIYNEFLEPLLDTFHTLQNYHVPDNKDDNKSNDNNTQSENGKAKTTPMMLRRNIAINLRLTDSWFREYQVLEGRTHPSMTMSQNGGYILMGTKLDPKTGTNELQEEDLKEIRARIGGRRKQQKGRQGGGGGGSNKRKSNEDGGGNGKKVGSDKRAKK